MRAKQTVWLRRELKLGYAFGKKGCRIVCHGSQGVRLEARDAVGRLVVKGIEMHEEVVSLAVRERKRVWLHEVGREKRVWVVEQ